MGTYQILHGDKVELLKEYVSFNMEETFRIPKGTVVTVCECPDECKVFDYFPGETIAFTWKDGIDGFCIIHVKKVKKVMEIPPFCICETSVLMKEGCCCGGL